MTTVNQPIGQLTLVGAGPGDPELITIKAIKAIEQAEVILYDALVNEELLQYAQSSAELIFVGKRRGCSSFLQEQINELIVGRALAGKSVLRLKGGDAFVFGRGAEEMEYAAEYGIQSTIIPGISSALAVPALQHIPMTKRNHAESFWVITGTTKEHQLSQDVILAAQSTATVVILMGMGKLDQIVHHFQVAGQGKTPIAIIQNGSLPTEKIGIGTIDSVLELVAEQQLTNPAVIVIGEVVQHKCQMERIHAQIQDYETVCA